MENIITLKRNRSEIESERELIKKRVYFRDNSVPIPLLRNIEGANRMESLYHLGCVLGGDIKWDDFMNDFADMLFEAPTLSVKVSGILIQIKSTSERKEIETTLRKWWIASRDALCEAAGEYFYIHSEKMTGRYFKALPKDIQGVISEYVFPLERRVWLSDGTWIPIFDALTRIFILSLFGPHRGFLSIALYSDTKKLSPDNVYISIKKDTITRKYTILVECYFQDSISKCKFETNHAFIRRSLPNKIETNDDLIIMYEMDLRTIMNILNYELSMSNGGSYDMFSDGALNNLFFHLHSYTNIDTHIKYEKIMTLSKAPLFGIKAPIFIPLIENFGSIMARVQCNDIANLEDKP